MWTHQYLFLYLYILHSWHDTCRVWIRKTFKEQSVSLLINELGFSSHPRTEDRSVKLLTCRLPPAPSCCCPGYVSEAPSWGVWGRSPGAVRPPSVHSDSGSSRRWSAQGPFCHTDTGWGGGSAPAGRAPCPACNLRQGEQSVRKIKGEMKRCKNRSKPSIRLSSDRSLTVEMNLFLNKLNTMSLFDDHEI